MRSTRLSDVLVSSASAAAALMIACWALLPLIVVAVVSLTSRKGLTAEWEYVGITNFEMVLRDHEFQNAVRNTIVYAVGSTSGQLAMGAFMAIVIWAWSPRVGRFLRRLFYLPYLIVPTVVAVVVWRFLGDSDVGLITSVSSRLGVPVRLFSPNLISAALILISIWIFAFFTMILVLARLEQIPSRHVEVVYLDGGNSWAAFRYVVMPEILPTLAATGAFRLVVMASKFDVPYLVLGSGRSGRVYGPASIYIYEVGYQQLLYGPASAAAVLLSIAVLLPLMLLIRRTWRFA